jgi:hypothetical protein
MLHVIFHPFSFQLHFVFVCHVMFMFTLFVCRSSQWTLKEVADLPTCNLFEIVLMVLFQHLKKKGTHLYIATFDNYVSFQVEFIVSNIFEW